jgi:predicted Fe-Mo cluster-binding NifX family protein
LKFITFIERRKKKMNTVVAVPSEIPGGLKAPIGAHFGHCELYTLIRMENGEISSVDVLPNVPHEQGGCMAPVSHLAKNRVRVLLAGGMGMRPLMGFQQMGIEVYHCGGAKTVEDAINAFRAGQLPLFSREFTCHGENEGSHCR